MSEKCNIRCYAQKGMFDGEWVVRIQTLAGEVQSIVDERSLNFLETDQPSEQEEIFAALLKAYCVGRAKEVASVVLPQPTLSNGPTITIPEAELVHD